MPLRDHFRPPLDHRLWRDGFFAGWPMVIVQALSRTLPPEYAATPRIYLGRERENPFAKPTIEPGDYWVRVYDRKHDNRLVGAIEIVSLANKESPERRRSFVAKCNALLQEQVSVIIIDLVTTRHFNLYHDLLELLLPEVTRPEPPPLYAVACRATRKADKWQVETWEHVLALGQPLPTLPLWLADNLALPLELEPSYEDTCRTLRIP